MGGLVHCSTVRYAIIHASSKKDDPERLVIAYPDEHCLRDLIAAPSIVGFGFRPREEAMAKLRAFEQECCPISMWYSAQQDGDAASRCGLIKNHRISCHILQRAFASINLFFYSRNVFSVLLRAPLGFSS
jgi:hypothetical protein